MKSVLSGKRPPAKILEEIIEALSNTAHLLASESGPHGFEFAVLELSSRGATLPAKKQRATTFAQFAKLLDIRHFGADAECRTNSLGLASCPRSEIRCRSKLSPYVAPEEAASSDRADCACSVHRRLPLAYLGFLP
jgi:hypothetical protein